MAKLKNDFIFPRLSIKTNLHMSTMSTNMSKSAGRQNPQHSQNGQYLRTQKGQKPHQPGRQTIPRETMTPEQYEQRNTIRRYLHNLVIDCLKHLNDTDLSTYKQTEGRGPTRFETIKEFDDTTTPFTSDDVFNQLSDPHVMDSFRQLVQVLYGRRFWIYGVSILQTRDGKTVGKRLKFIVSWDFEAPSKHPYPVEFSRMRENLDAPSTDNTDDNDTVDTKVDQTNLWGV